MATSSVKQFIVGIYGAGVVAGGVVQQLRAKRADFLALGIQFDVKTICCRDVAKERDFELDPGTTKTADPNVIVDDADINMVVEVMGGNTVAKDVLFKALQRGKHVVTANKALLAAELPAIIAALRESPASLAFEAAVGGGIPCIRVFQHALLSDKFHRVSGILNGTTNFMLSAMESRGVSYADILKEAQDAGFAEADPTADVCGFDARSKIVLLAKLAYGIAVPVADVPCTGITAVTTNDFSYAKDNGYTVKLLGVAQPEGDKLAVYVSPTLVPLSDAAAAVSGATNLVQATTEFLGTSSYIGAGAGRFPTSNSVVADMLNIGLGKASSPVFPRETSEFTGLAADYSAVWYARLPAAQADAFTGAVHAAGLSCRDAIRVGDDVVFVTAESTSLSTMTGIMAAVDGASIIMPFAKAPEA